MALIDLLYPKQCINCKRSGYYICPKCISDVSLRHQKCIYCQKPSVDGFTHIKCFRKFGIDGSVSVFSYDGVVKEGIRKLKYRFVSELAGDMADYIGFFMRKNITALPKVALLVPIPLHPKRERWRGFNQSEKLGSMLAKKMDWKPVPNLIIRSKFTRPQVELKGSERRQNLKGVFAVKPKLNISRSIFDIPVILFDDVITTGATIKEAGKVLKRAGFKVVWGLSVAG